MKGGFVDKKDIPTFSPRTLDDLEVVQTMLKHHILPDVDDISELLAKLNIKEVARRENEGGSKMKLIQIDDESFVNPDHVVSVKKGKCDKETCVVYLSDGGCIVTEKDICDVIHMLTDTGRSQ